MGQLCSALRLPDALGAPPCQQAEVTTSGVRFVPATAAPDPRSRDVDRLEAGIRASRPHCAAWAAAWRMLPSSMGELRASRWVEPRNK